MQNSYCPFCDPEINLKQMICDGKYVKVLYCLTPTAEGNILIVPKRHITRFDLLNREEMYEIQDFISQLNLAYQNILGIDQYILIQKNGKNAGQTVDHMHFHMIPCKDHSKDYILRALNIREKINSEEMSKQVEVYKNFFTTLKVG